MKQVFITGTSSGIGKALAEAYLTIGDIKVIGIARRNLISHKNYRHEVLDLSDAKATESFEFFIPDNVSEVVLINNAGWLGEVGRLGDLDSENITRLFQVNTAAPIILMNNFLKAIKKTSVKAKVFNVSSGVSQYPVDGWSNYCASKAALDMASRVVKVENPELDIYSVAPGIIDTEMQAEIRETNPKRFVNHSRFVDYHKNGQLRDANDVAGEIIDILQDKIETPETVFALKK